MEDGRGHESPVRKLSPVLPVLPYRPRSSQAKPVPPRSLVAGCWPLAMRLSDQLFRAEHGGVRAQKLVPGSRTSLPSHACPCLPPNLAFPIPHGTMFPRPSVTADGMRSQDGRTGQRRAGQGKGDRRTHATTVAKRHAPALRYPGSAGCCSAGALHPSADVSDASLVGLPCWQPTSPHSSREWRQEPRSPRNRCTEEPPFQ